MFLSSLQILAGLLLMGCSSADLAMVTTSSEIGQRLPSGPGVVIHDLQWTDSGWTIALSNQLSPVPEIFPILEPAHYLGRIVHANPAHHPTEKVSLWGQFRGNMNVLEILPKSIFLRQRPLFGTWTEVSEWKLPETSLLGNTGMFVNARMSGDGTKVLVHRVEEGRRIFELKDFVDRSLYAFGVAQSGDTLGDLRNSIRYLFEAADRWLAIVSIPNASGQAHHLELVDIFSGRLVEDLTPFEFSGEEHFIAWSNNFRGDTLAGLTSRGEIIVWKKRSSLPDAWRPLQRKSEQALLFSRIAEWEMVMRRKLNWSELSPLTHIALNPAGSEVAIATPGRKVLIADVILEGEVPPPRSE